MDGSSVVYVVPDKMGGALNLVAGLLAHRQPDGLTYRAVLTQNSVDHDSRCCGRLPCDGQTVVSYSLDVENLYAVLRRVRLAIGSGPGVLVTSDFIELASVSAHDTGRTVIMIVHGDYDYYYDMALRHEPVVHAYVAPSRRIYERLLERLPHRASSIFYIPHGVHVPVVTRPVRTGPLRLIFVGRLTAGKGILDLPQIDARLAAAGVEVAWTVVGSGPDEARLRSAWKTAGHVTWTGQVRQCDVEQLLHEHDVFVLPTRAEGFPLSLLEAMAVGLVPVVSALDSGIPELVMIGRTGFAAPVGDVEAFAGAIVMLARDRGRLAAMGASARALVAARFDVRDRARDHQALYARHAELYRPRRRDARVMYGSRLDRPWIPNAIVKAIRGYTRAASSPELAR